MGFGRIPDGDNLFRHCFHPVSFRGNKSTRFAPDKLIQIKHEVDGLHASLVWERYAPTTASIHDQGCRASFKRNQKISSDRHSSRTVYCGAYQLTGESVRALAGAANLEEVVFADVIHQIEQGEIAHADVRIVLEPGGGDIEGTKTAILDRLWSACSGPARHICTGDENFAPHPSSNLADGPRGQYFDSRSDLKRRWHLFRYQIFNFLWRNSTRELVTRPDTRFPLVRLAVTIKFHTCNWLWRVCSRNGSPSNGS